MLCSTIYSNGSWQVPLDVICVSLFHLSCYYQREIIRGQHLFGSWHLKEEFSYLQHDSSLIPFLPKAIDPKEIVAKARETILSQYEEISTASNDSSWQRVELGE